MRGALSAIVRELPAVLVGSVAAGAVGCALAHYAGTLGEVLELRAQRDQLLADVRRLEDRPAGCASPDLRVWYAGPGGPGGDYRPAQDAPGRAREDPDDPTPAPARPGAR